ncbi:MAG: hypothetical protein Fur0019_13190 [Tibeticola sp.]
MPSNSADLSIRLRVDSDQAAAALSAVGDRVQQFGARAKAGMDEAASGADRMASAIARIGQYGAGLLALNMVAGIGRNFLQAADGVTALNNQLKLATGSTVAAAQAYEGLFETAQRSRVGFAELGATYASLSRAGQEIGVSQQRMLAVTEAVGNAMAISGGSAASMQAALVQLGQAMASGVLRGEELNSVMEQAPRLAKALADGMGVSIGQLRSLGAEGKITADQVVRALENQAAVLRGEVAGATMTVSQSWTQLGNATLDAIGKFDKATGASDAVARAISGAADAITAAGKAFSDNKGTISLVLGVLGGAATAAGVLRVAGAIGGAGGVVAAIGAARAAFLGLSAAMAANPLGLALLGIGVVTGAAIGMGGKPSDAQGLAREIEYQSGRIAAAEKQLAATGGRGELTRGLEERIAAMRKTRDAMQAELSAMQAAGIDTRAEDARLAAHTAQVREQKKAEEDLDRFRQKSSGLPESYFENMKEAIRLNQLGLLTGKEWTAFLAKEQAEVARKLGGEPKKKTDGPDAELAGLRARLTEAQAYHQQLVALGAGATQLNTAERDALKLADQVAQATDAKVRARLMEKAAIAQQTGELMRWNDTIAGSARAHQAMVDALGKDADGLMDRARAQEVANAAMGKGRTAIEQMTLAELEHQMAQAQASDRFDPQYIAALERKIDAQRRWVAALEQGDIKAASGQVDEIVRGAQAMAAAFANEQALAGLSAVERQKVVALRQVELKYAKELAEIDKLSEASAEQAAAKAALRDQVEQARRIEGAAAVARIEQEEAARSAQEINRSLTDALMRGFESGKDFAKNFRATVVNMFQTMVLRPTISAVLSPVSNAISAVLSPVSNAISAVVSSGLSAFGLGGQAASMAGLFGAADAMAASTIASNISAGVAAGLTTSEATAAAVAAGQAAGAAAGGGIMSALSTVPGWGWALGGAALLASVLGGRGETRSGASYAVGADGRATKTEGPSGGEINGDAVRAAIETTVTTINGVLKSLGSAASISGFVAGLESSKNGKGFVFAGGRVGDVAFGEAAGRSSVEAMGNLTAEQAVAALALDLKQATIQALQAAQDLPDAVKRQLDGVNAETLTTEEADRLISTLTQQAQAVAGFRDAVAALPFEGLKSLSYDATVAMLDAAGGLQNFTAAAQSYYSNFYSAEEQQAFQMQRLSDAMAALGLVVPETADAFRGLVEAALAAGDAARAAQLMALSADVIKVLDAQSSATSQQAKSADAMADWMSRASESSASSASAMSASTRSVSDAWKSASDALIEEVKRIRGVASGEGAGGLAAAKANFAIALAQAQAGDVEAMKKLPELSRTMLELAAKNTTSAVEWRRIQARTAAQLEALAAGRATGGAPSAGRLGSGGGGVVDGPVWAFSASAYPSPPSAAALFAAPPAQSPAQSTAIGADAAAQRLERIEQNTLAGAQHAHKVARLLERVVRDGDAVYTKQVTP